jgi:aminopeptidase N
MKHGTFAFFLRNAFAAVVPAALCLLLSSPAVAQRLPTNVTPTHYTLTLTPDLRTATFTGVEKIDVNLKEPANSITLNAAELKFQSVILFPDGRRQTGSVSLDPQKEQATFTFPNTIPAGSATLEIHYTGILNNELRGFYLSKTAKRNYAVTQFEPTDARRAFPCFDEPAFKARFDISLIVDSGDTAISNGQIVSDTPGPGNGKHTLVFSTTPKMSTYLVAFLVGDFQCTAGTSEGVDIRVCATPDKVKLTSYALDVAKYVLDYYDNYFQIPYPLKKLDLIAIPDFEAGAMENFGAITYRETDLLLDPKTASVASKQNVAVVVAHEMAHQWFGDLVTMAWWNNIWLNEGFATWMETKPVAAMHPEWHMDQVDATTEQATLNLDSQPTTRAIRAPEANTPAEINQLFDGISYGKAGAVLNMLENYLGKETFRRGVHAYLTAHEYANATAQDFWNAQTVTSHQPVDKIMESLVVQPGVPIVTFGKPAGGQVPVTQRRFFSDPQAKSNGDEKWSLPVCFQASGGTQKCQLLTPSTASLQIPQNTLFFANAGGKGYYRSAYAPQQYKALVAAVETGLTPPERISLAGDEWAQVRTDNATVGDFLNLAAAMKSDSNPDVLSQVQGSFATIYHHVAATAEERKQLGSWVERTYEPGFKELGAPSPSDSPDKRELRATLFGMLGFYAKDPTVLEQAREFANQYLDNPASVEPSLAQTALAIAAENGDAQLFDRLQKLYETGNNPELQENALRYLAEFENPDLEKRALEYAVSDKVRNQDAAIQFAIALRIAETRPLAWSFIKDNWDKVHAQLTTNMGSILVRATGGFCSAAQRSDVQSFFSTHKVEAADVALQHALEQISGCMQLRQAQEPKLKHWLANQH